MVLLRHSLYVAVGSTVAVYGIAFALVSGSFEAAAITTLPGAWLAAYGLLNGIALATDDSGPGESGRDAAPDSDDGPEDDEGEDEEGEEPDDDALHSAPLFRTPY